MLNTSNTRQKEGSDTVRDLEATSWAACLDSLCRRLRTTAKAVDSGEEGTLDGGKQAFASDNTARSTGVDPLVGPSDPSDDPSAANEERPQQRCLREELPVNTAVWGQGSSVPTTAKKMFSAVSAWDGDTVSLDESQNRQAVQALPLLRRRPARRKTGEDLLWLDKTILKVGARVPWGRLHRGRFAKVRYCTPVLRRDYTQTSSIRTNHSHWMVAAIRTHNVAFEISVCSYCSVYSSTVSIVV